MYIKLALIKEKKVMKNKFYFFDSEALKYFQKRIFFSITIFVFVFFIAFYRITDIMILSKSSDSKINFEQIIDRGSIYDRNGNLLSSTIKSHSLSVNPNNLNNFSDKIVLAEKLSTILFKPKDEILNSLNKKNNFVWLKRNISPKEHQAIIDLGEVALRTEHLSSEEKRRIYPYKNVASHVLGYTDTESYGLAGIERGLDKKLSNGEDIHLTIDINLQHSVRKELFNTIEKFSADSGIALIIDITNGEILSMNSIPDFDPNDRKTINQKNTFNRTIEANYEMGSVFKPITVAMGVDKGIIDSNMLFDVTKPIKGIQDFHPFKGSLNIKDCIVKSSNICTAKISKKIGSKNQKAFFNKIGFNKKLEFEILEAANPLGNKNNWGEIETMTIGFGHGFAITPLHLVSAYATLINDGYKIKPTLIRKTFNQTNTKVIKTETSKYITKLLRSVVIETEYTGPRVKVEGYEIGGKTGTAELIDKYGKYQKDKNMTSFVGVFPVSNPKYAVLAMIENPKKIEEENFSITGATVAAPLVKNIILRMIEILGIPKPQQKELLKADTTIDYDLVNNATF